MKTYAFDVAMNELVGFDGEQIFKLENTANAIRSWLKGVGTGSIVAVESTGGYGTRIAAAAATKGATVYIVQPRQLKAFREAEGSRAKTDRLDAKLLYRFIEMNQARLRPFVPLKEPLATLRNLVRARHTLARKRHSVYLSMKTQVGAKFAKQAVASLDKSLKQLEDQIKELVKNLRASEEIQKLPGVGPLVAAAALCLLESKELESGDAFIAHMGLDPVSKDSGQKTGKRHLSKRGDKVLRSLLYMSALSATRSMRYRDWYTNRKAEGKLKGRELLIALARKLARAIFAIHQKQRMAT